MPQQKTQPFEGAQEQGEGQCLLWQRESVNAWEPAAQRVSLWPGMARWGRAPVPGFPDTSGIGPLVRWDK